MKIRMPVVVCLLLASILFGSERESTGLGAYLLQPLSPEYITLGNPYSVPLSSPASLFYNPAGLAQINSLSIQCNYNFIPKIFDQSSWNISLAFPLPLFNLYPAVGVISHKIDDINFYNEEMEFQGNFSVTDLALFSGIAYKSFAYNLGFALLYSLNSTPNYEYEDINFFGSRFGMSLNVTKNVKLNFVYFGTSAVERKSSWSDSIIVESTNELASASISFQNKRFFNTNFSFSGIFDVEHQQYRPFYFNGGISVGYHFTQIYWVKINVGVNHLNIDSDERFKYFEKYARRMSMGISMIVKQNIILNYSVLQEFIGLTHQVGFVFAL